MKKNNFMNPSNQSPNINHPHLETAESYLGSPHPQGANKHANVFQGFSSPPGGLFSSP
jgi:hypothetical protein